MIVTEWVLWPFCEKPACYMSVSRHMLFEPQAMLLGWQVFWYVGILPCWPRAVKYHCHWLWASLVAWLVKNLPAMRETWVWSLGWKDPLEKGKATHSSILAWRIPWTVESRGSQRVGHDWMTFTFTGYEDVSLITLTPFLLFPHGGFVTSSFFSSWYINCS